MLLGSAVLFGGNPTLCLCTGAFSRFVLNPVLAEAIAL